MRSLLQQLKKRRLELGLKQNDMELRIGVSRQQYQRLESKGNPRLETLELVAKGLNSELMLIPQDKLPAVLAVLEGSSIESKNRFDSSQPAGDRGEPSEGIDYDPWRDLLTDDS
ncbi:MAG: helix-turn-helix transcriptional regulator [Arenicella sp.]|nr:helix-turn-helix transcriptional regulator [Arenicella sp.]